jgi:hypothetical protein
MVLVLVNQFEVTLQGIEAFWTPRWRSSGICTPPSHHDFVLILRISVVYLCVVLALLGACVRWDRGPKLVCVKTCDAGCFVISLYLVCGFINLKLGFGLTSKKLHYNLQDRVRMYSEGVIPNNWSTLERKHRILARLFFQMYATLALSTSRKGQGIR